MFGFPKRVSLVRLLVKVSCPCWIPVRFYSSNFSCLNLKGFFVSPIALLSDRCFASTFSSIVANSIFAVGTFVHRFPNRNQDSAWSFTSCFLTLKCIEIAAEWFLLFSRRFDYASFSCLWDSGQFATLGFSEQVLECLLWFIHKVLAGLPMTIGLRFVKELLRFLSLCFW